MIDKAVSMLKSDSPMMAKIIKKVYVDDKYKKSWLKIVRLMFKAALTIIEKKIGIYWRTNARKWVNAPVTSFFWTEKPASLKKH